jgi:hypothetical protein
MSFVENMHFVDCSLDCGDGADYLNPETGEFTPAAGFQYGIFIKAPEAGQ